MLSNKDIRVENGNLIINGVKYPLDTIEIKEEVEALTETVGDETGGLVKDVSDLSDTVGDSTGGLVKDVDDLTDLIGDITQTGLTGDSVAGQITELVNGKPERFVSSSNTTTQNINIGTAGGNRMYLLSCGYSTQYGDHYVFALVLINDSNRIKCVSLVADSGITVSATFENGIVSLTFSEQPYANAVLIRLS